MSRFTVYHQHKLEKLIWVDTGYEAPGFLDVDAIDTMDF